MTTTVPTATAPIRGACRHDATISGSTSVPNPSSTIHAVRNGQAVIDHTAQTGRRPLVSLSDAPTGVAEVPCRENDAELWFAESPDDVEFAKSLCGTCPARLSCLEGAMARREPWGVWGGELFVMGQVVPRKRPRGRPRKDAVA